MAWTTPRTYVAGELMTAAIGNTHWRDNFALLKTSISDDGLTWTGALAPTGDVTLSGASAILSFTGATAPEILFNTNANGRVFANQSLIFGIDKDNTSTGEAFYWRINNATDVMSLTESAVAQIGIGTSATVNSGALGIGVNPTYQLHVRRYIGPNYVAAFENSYDSGNVHCAIFKYSTLSPNNTSSIFWSCEDGGGTNRSHMRANGGLANFSANDVNLSDLGAKDITGPAPSQRSKIRALKFYRGRYKDSTRGHDDLMWGAQDILAIDPEWTDVWQEEERDERGAVVKPRLLGTRDHVIFMANVFATSELIGQVDDHETRIRALEAA